MNSKMKMNIAMKSSQGRALWQTIVAAGVGLAAVATLLPAYLSVQGRARTIAGAQNLQQWGIALNLHLMDNANQLPEVGSASIDPTQAKAWYNSLPEYVSQPALAAIPVGQRPRPGEKSLWMDPASKALRAIPAESFYFNYGMNKFLQPTEQDRAVRFTELPNPGRVVFMTRVAGYTPWVIPDDVVFPAAVPDTAYAHVATPVLFCDGHAELVSRQDLVSDPKALEATPPADGVSWFVR